MPIERGTGDLLDADVDALVNAVNCVGVMGKGLAAQFKKVFPDVFAEYARACKRGEVRPGKVHVVSRREVPRHVINFPTKDHWRGASRIEWIRDGLASLVQAVRSLGIRSIAIPPLGCGLGGLEWAAVRPLIQDAFAEMPAVRVVLFEPR